MAVARLGLEVAGVASNAANLSAIRQGLAELGYVSEIRNEPPSRASNACTWLVMPVGTIHVATTRASRSAR